MAYRSVKFSSVLAGVMSLGGMGAAAADADARAQALEFINARLAEAWEHEFWAELCPAELRAYRPEWAAGDTYAAGTELLYTWSDGRQLYYSANSAPNTPAAGQSPESHPAKWTELAQFRRAIALDQPGKTPIGEVFALYDRDPVMDPKHARTVRFQLTDQGVVPICWNAPTVWVRFRLRPPVFTLDPWDASRTYYAGDTVYDEESGECYRCLQTTTGDGVGALIYWGKLLFPYVLQAFVKRAAYADMLPADGEGNAAGRELSKAYRALNDSADNATLSQGQATMAQVRTY